MKDDRGLARAWRPLHWWQKVRAPGVMWQSGIRCLVSGLAATVVGVLFLIQGRYNVLGGSFVVAGVILTLVGLLNFRDYTRTDRRRPH